jgi:hypothetical protein
MQMNRRTAVTLMAAAAGTGTALLCKTGNASAAQTTLAHSHPASFIERTDGTDCS